MVQEYLSNAKDACIEAGKTSEAIEVTLPTALNPQFSIRDYGVGMSDERVREVFVRYGISTKRETNKQLGCFGIGAKSGWAYTDSFIVESFYEGIHRQYIADIAENREGRLLLHKEAETTEPNGVFLKIPVDVKDMSIFNHAYLRATFLWDKKPKVKCCYSYPTLLYDLGDIQVYGGFFKTSDLLVYSTYFNVIGIPFEITEVSIGYKYIFQKIQYWCQGESIALVIKGNPLKMDISANREGFTNLDYASKKIEYANKKICDYVQEVFEKAALKDYGEVFSKHSLLVRLYDNFFKGKHYVLRKSAKEVVLDIEVGYFLELVKKKKFLSCKKVRLQLGSGTVFLSRSSGEILDKKTAPILLPETKKAMTYAKWARGRVEEQYIFFRDTLSEEQYKEISEIIGAVEYIEDYYTTNSEKYKLFMTEQRKEQRELRKQQKELELKQLQDQGQKQSPSIKCKNFKKYNNRSVNCSLDNNFYDLDVITQNSYMVFYSDFFRTQRYDLIRPLNFNIAVVYVAKSDFKKVEALNNPKIKPMAFLETHIEKDEILLEHICDIYYLKKYETLWEFLQKNKIESKKFNVDDMYVKMNKLLFSLKNNHFYIGTYTKYVEIFKGECIFKKFLDTYSLLKSCTYGLKCVLLSHINLYIKSVDEASDGFKSSSNE